MIKIKSVTALIRSLKFEFGYEQKEVDLLQSAVPERTLIKAVNFVRRYKPFDRQWLKAKIKEYIKPVLPVRAPSIPQSAMTKERFDVLKKELDQTVKHIINH